MSKEITATKVAVAVAIAFAAGFVLALGCDPSPGPSFDDLLGVVSAIATFIGLTVSMAGLVVTLLLYQAARGISVQQLRGFQETIEGLEQTILSSTAVSEPTEDRTTDVDVENAPLWVIHAIEQFFDSREVNIASVQRRGSGKGNHPWIVRANDRVLRVFRGRYGVGVFDETPDDDQSAGSD